MDVNFFKSKASILAFVFKVSISAFRVVSGDFGGAAYSFKFII